MSNQDKPDIAQFPVYTGYYPAGTNPPSISVNANIPSGYDHPMVQDGSNYYDGGLQALYDSSWTPEDTVTVSITVPSSDWQVAKDENINELWDNVSGNTWTYTISASDLGDVVTNGQTRNIHFYFHDTASQMMRPARPRGRWYDPAIHITPPQR